MLNLIGMILLSPCPFWIRFCQLSIYQKFLNLFGVENWNQSGLFDTLPSSLNLLGGAKKKTSWFHSSCQWGLKVQRGLHKDSGPIAILWQLAAAHHSAQWGISFPITWFYWNSWPWNLDRFSLCMFNLFMRLLGGWIGLKRSKSSYIWPIFLMLTIKIEQL